MAVNAHGYARSTKDGDVVVQLARANIQRAFSVAVRFVSLPTLIDTNRTVARPQDLIDVEHLNERVKDLG